MKKKSKRELKPKLRFPEFQDSGEWEKKSLSDTCERILEKVGQAMLTPVSITAGHGFVSQVDKFGRDISGAQYKNYIFLRHGDFAYNKGNSKKHPQGYVCQLKEFEQAAASSAFICFRLKKEYEARFLQGLFDKNTHGRQLAKYITSGARSDGLLNINPAYFFDIKLPIPPQIEEQQKIADCLSSLDELITAQTQKTAGLKAHKKGLMQQLFPAEGKTLPKLRFPEFRDVGEWGKDKLGKVSLFVNDKMPIDQLSLANFVSTQNILPDYEGLIAASKLPLSGTATRYKINDILISNIPPYLKKIWHASKEGGASNDVIVVRTKERLINRYLSFMLKNDVFIEYVMKGAKGVKMPRGDISLMKEYLLVYPSKAEQQKIADCLSSIDELITAQTQKIKTLKSHKKGLMQQLFPSLDEVKA